MASALGAVGVAARVGSWSRGEVPLICRQPKSLLLLVLPLMLALPGVQGRPPRQPSATYVQAPEVPEPSSYALVDLMQGHDFAGLDADGDGRVGESELAKAVEAAVQAAADVVWASVDINGNEQLDLEELIEAVKPHRKASGKFLAPVKRWSFLWLLAQHFTSIDLSRSARISVPAARKLVGDLLRSVRLLDERRNLFDEVAGPGVGDDFGTFAAAEWTAWQANAKAKRRRRRHGRGGTSSEL
mmetsp:Transcript_31813/g.80660  ORF Transcript_31813/g.80660 Transcript_31813/m.80660 type:complete len:243 (-) Transcript_31813:41-769(-)